MAGTILVVDDEKMITSTLASLIKMMLKERVIVYNDPRQALETELLTEQKVDLVISDFMMPGMNGIEFLNNVREKSPETVTILLTGYADKENAIRSINEVGLYYYMEKPWDNHTLIKIIRNGLEKKQLSDSLRKKFMELEDSNREISRLYELLKKDYRQEADSAKNLVISLANVIEAKDKYTDGHARRVGCICRKIAEKLKLGEEALDHMEIAGIIHDIGKVGVSDVILNKPGRLTEEEYEIIKTHPAVGETICRPLNCLQPCLDAIRHHHEKLDGSGYPDGLEGDNISLNSRILAVADVFDALYSDRPYRSRMPMEKVREIMESEAEKRWLDGTVVEVLFTLLDSGELNEIIEANIE